MKQKPAIVRFRNHRPFYGGEEVKQRQPILESPHFWTGTALLGLLGLNGAIAFTGFGGNKDSLRITHAYLGTLAVGLMLIHGILGLKLGLSI